MEPPNPDSNQDDDSELNMESSVFFKFKSNKERTTGIPKSFLKTRLSFFVLFFQ